MFPSNDGKKMEKLLAFDESQKCQYSTTKMVFLKNGLRFSSLIYTSYGQLGHFLLQLWLRENEKYKTRVLNGPINFTTRPRYILVRHS